MAQNIWYFMSEFPGFLIWHIAGPPWYSYREIETLTESFNDIQKSKAEANRPRPR